MRIGQLADKTDTTTKTIRYYEQIGLLPEPPRTPAGYRDYANDTTDLLRFIRSGQRAGMSLNDLKGIIEVRASGRTPCNHVTELIDTKISDIETRIADLERTKNELDSLRTEAKHLKPDTCGNGTICHIIYNPTRT